MILTYRRITISMTRLILTIKLTFEICSALIKNHQYMSYMFPVCPLTVLQIHNSGHGFGFIRLYKWHGPNIVDLFNS